MLLAVVALLHYSPEPNATQPVPGIDDSAWIDSFSILKYQPLIRLASKADEDYLTANLGKEAYKAYAKLRRTIIRDYLRSLASDFSRIQEIATAKCVRASSDDGNLSAALVEQQMSFIFQIWTIEARLFLGEFIPCPIKLDSMLSRIELFAAQTRELTRPHLHYTVV